MKASEYRKLKAGKAEPTAPVTLPSGAVFTLRRLPIDVWTKAGRVPDFFVQMSIEATRGTLAETAPELDAKESLAALQFMREAVMYCVVEPVLKYGATNDEAALDPSEIDAEDMDFLTEYVLKRGCPDVPVLTKGGETSVATLATFRQKVPGGTSVWDSPSSEQVREATQ